MLRKKFEKYIYQIYHTNWFKPSFSEKLPDIKSFMESKDKTDIRLMNLMKAYDAVRIKRWSHIAVDPQLVDTSDLGEDGEKISAFE